MYDAKLVLLESDDTHDGFYCVSKGGIESVIESINARVIHVWNIEQACKPPKVCPTPLLDSSAGAQDESDIMNALKLHCSVASPRRPARGTMARKLVIKVAVAPLQVVKHASVSASPQLPLALAARDSPSSEMGSEGQRDSDEEDVDG